mmetsp:Transcript_27701/g.77898  ORF Transcript_27701/g.77898 Transcript_27701/m.77898 type:complete len:589 (+) Transcript_27701:1-1767(+)
MAFVNTLHSIAQSDDLMMQDLRSVPAFEEEKPTSLPLCNFSFLTMGCWNPCGTEDDDAHEEKLAKANVQHILTGASDAFLRSDFDRTQGVDVYGASVSSKSSAPRSKDPKRGLAVSFAPKEDARKDEEEEEEEEEDVQERSPSIATTTAPSTPDVSPAESLAGAPPPPSSSAPASASRPPAPPLPTPDRGASAGAVGAARGPDVGADECQGVDDIIISSAMRAGRAKEVERRLISLETGHYGDTSARESMSDVTLERLGRISSCFEESLKELKTSGTEGWRRESKEEHGVEFSFRVADDHFQVVSITEFEGIDALHAFVGLTEFDLSKQFLPRTQDTHLLQRFGTGDTLWRELGRGSVVKQDNILHVSSMDALDEPLGALWVSVYTPGMHSGAHFGTGRPERAECIPRSPHSPHLPQEEVCGIVPPAPQEGSVRVDFWKAVFIITPLWGNTRMPGAKLGNGRPPACRLTLGLCRKPSSASCIFPTSIRKEIESLMTNFRSFLETCHELSWRTVASPNAMMYECVRRHLNEKKPSGSIACKPLLRIPFPVLSAYCPETWADFCEPSKLSPAADNLLNLAEMEYYEPVVL